MIESERIRTKGWFGSNFCDNRKTGGFPFDFAYGGKRFTENFSDWEVKCEMMELANGKTQHVMVLTEDRMKLSVKCVIVEFISSPAVEWTLYFTNFGTSKSPVIEKIDAISATFHKDRPEPFTVHHSRGSTYSVDAFEPLETRLEQGLSFELRSVGGRATNKDLTYFNIECGGEAVILSVGWPGQWFIRFECGEQDGISVRSGQEEVHIRLLPGEEIRTPLMTLLFLNGSYIDNQNAFRRWMREENMPKPDGKPLEPMLACCGSSSCDLMVKATEENQIELMSRFIEEKLPVRYWQMDAGWYPNRNFNWANTGTWIPDPERFPKGIGPVSDFAHAHGIKTILWVEPERVTFDTWLSNTHPEWLLEHRPGDRTKLLDLGNPEAYGWLVNHVDNLIKENGIDVYRQDFNMDPLEYWRANDEEDRQGARENHHIVGYFNYWDELLSRNPGLMIDTCASGGRRDDLETLRRSVPLWRDDACFEILAEQSHQYALPLWIPFHGTGTALPEGLKTGSDYSLEYVFRSHMCPSLILAYDMRRADLDFDRIRKLAAEFLDISPYYMDDYYPLTEYGLSEAEWAAWQYHDPVGGSGMVQAFRRSECDDSDRNFKLTGLNAWNEYRIRDYGREGGEIILKGVDLIENGLTVRIDGKPGATSIRYDRL